MEKLFDGEFRLMEILWREAPIGSTRLVKLCQQELGWNQEHHLYGAAPPLRKGAAQNEKATVTPLVTREQALQAEGTPW